MKTQNPQDERVVAQRRKINSEAHGILIIALLSSILIQQFLLNAPFEQYAAEFICFFGVSFYIIIRYMMVGLSIHGESKQAKVIYFINSIVAGAAVTTITGILNYAQYAERYKEDGTGYFIAMLAITFISASFLCFVVLSGVYYLNKKKQAKIQKHLDEDEQED